jgi:hypothetical protein
LFEEYCNFFFAEHNCFYSNDPSSHKIVSFILQIAKQLDVGKTKQNKTGITQFVKNHFVEIPKDDKK